MSARLDPLVIWHDVECGSYTADLALWRELAGAAAGPVLDVGAGTGRVALDLAARGVRVVALDREPVLLAALEERAHARGVSVETVCADAAGFDVGEHAFALVIVPMQTLQLLPGSDARGGFLRSAHRHLPAGGRVAIALAPTVEPFEPGLVTLPEPDTAEIAGFRYLSQPTGVRVASGFLELERRRDTVAADGARMSELDLIRLADIAPDDVEEEARPAGFGLEARRRIPETDRHVGSDVVMLRA
jgi:SAM-dependent methyltransferase